MTISEEAIPAQTKKEKIVLQLQKALILCHYVSITENSNKTAPIYLSKFQC